MPEDKTKEAPHAVEHKGGEAARFEGAGSRQHATKEATQRGHESAEDAVKPGPTPDPGIHEGYGANSGRHPSEEPGNPKKDDARGG